MASGDRKPLPNAAGTPRIAPTANNRLGAVLSSIYSFWLARQAASSQNAQLGGNRRDAYSIIFFSKKPLICVESDFTSTPDQLLASCLRYKPFENENYTLAIEKAQDIMTSNWSTERYESPLSGDWLQLRDKLTYVIERLSLFSYPTVRVTLGISRCRTSVVLL